MKTTYIESLDQYLSENVLFVGVWIKNEGFRVCFLQKHHISKKWAGRYWLSTPIRWTLRGLKRVSQGYSKEHCILS